jgi:CheY-like chemotaxis protein
MTDLIRTILPTLEKYLPGAWMLVLLLAMAVVYMWYLYHRAKLLQDRILFEQRRREVATEDFERILKFSHLPSSQPDALRREEPPTVKRRRVIVVDDERSICEVIGEVLSAEISSLEIVLAEDGIEAMREIEKQLPSLLIMDIVMPRMDGIQVLLEIKRRGWKFPTILVSAYYLSKEALAKRADGLLPPYDLMPKPFEAEKLISAAKKALSN